VVGGVDECVEFFMEVVEGVGVGVVLVVDGLVWVFDGCDVVVVFE